ncbi:hypothetical protein BH09MYX1_BH09MYX1_35050 [soil metagenome]
MLTAFTVDSWLRQWLDGADLWRELFEERETTVLNPFTRKPVVTTVRASAKGVPWSDNAII